MFAVDDIEDAVARLHTHGAELVGEVGSARTSIGSAAPAAVPFHGPGHENGGPHAEVSRHPGTAGAVRSRAPGDAYQVANVSVMAASMAQPRPGSRADGPGTSAAAA